MHQLAVEGGKHPCGIFFLKRCYRFQDEFSYLKIIDIESH